MAPMGRKPLQFPGKRDVHPRKPLVNWWEVALNQADRRKAERQRAKRLIARFDQRGMSDD